MILLLEQELNSLIWPNMHLGIPISVAIKAFATLEVITHVTLIFYLRVSKCKTKLSEDRTPFPNRVGLVPSSNNGQLESGGLFPSLFSSSNKNTVYIKKIIKRRRTTHLILLNQLSASKMTRKYSSSLLISYLNYVSRYSICLITSRIIR